jgi:hypothetical protein
MMGLPVGLKSGLNHIEYVETLLGNMAMLIQRIEQSGGMAEEKDIIGFQNIAQHIGQHVQIIAQDPNEKERVREYGDDLGKLMNLVKAYTQRLQEQRGKAQEAGQGGPDPELQAKIQATLITAKAKAENTRDAHAQRTAQREVQFTMDQKRKDQAHAAEMQKRMAETHVEVASKDIKTAAEIAQSQAKAESEPKQESPTE